MDRYRVFISLGTGVALVVEIEFESKHFPPSVLSQKVDELCSRLGGDLRYMEEIED